MSDTTDLVRRLRGAMNANEAFLLIYEAADAIERLSAPAEPVAKRCYEFAERLEGASYALPGGWDQEDNPRPRNVCTEAADFLREIATLQSKVANQSDAVANPVAPAPDDEPSVMGAGWVRDCPAPVAPDTATVDQIIALAHQMRLACLNWIDLPAGEERARRCTEYQNASDTLRAAVEQLHLTAVNANRAYNTANERAERAEAINREWTAAADRARQPAEFYKDYNEGTMRAMQALMSRAEAERDALLAELRVYRDREYP